MKLQLRPSKMPGFMKCASFAAEPKAPDNSTSEPAAVGTCIHDIFENTISQGVEPSPDTIKTYALKHGVEYSGYGGVARKTHKLYEKYTTHAAEYFQFPETEKKMSYTLANGFKMEGTADLVQVHADFAVILDLKTGELDLFDSMVQIKTYALMLLRMCEHLGTELFYGYMFNPVLEIYHVKIWPTDDLKKFELEIMAQMENVGKTYSPGSHCQYCPNLVSCPKHLESSKALLAGGAVREFTVETIKKCRPMYKHMQAAIAAYEEAEKALLAKENEISLGDGTKLCYTQQTRKSFNAGDVIKLLAEHRECELDAIVPYVKITQGGIDEFIKNTSSHGMKGKDVKEFKTILGENPDCFEETVINKRTIRQEKKLVKKD